MSKKVIIVAPHPDDETLGCGGTLLKHITAGDEVHWLIITDVAEQYGFTTDRVAARTQEIERIASFYGFAATHNLALPPARLDTVPRGELVAKIAAVFSFVMPHVVYIPFRGDVHSDHGIAFDAVAACTKWFRCPSVQRVLAYETLSETEQGLIPVAGFAPTFFVNIAEQLTRKLEAVAVYASEIGKFPFPRSPEAVRALAALRGATAGCAAAEAFVLLREIA